MAQVFRVSCAICSARVSRNTQGNGIICNDSDIVFYESHLIFRSDLKQSIVQKKLIQVTNDNAKCSKMMPYYYECIQCQNKIASAVFMLDRNDDAQFQIALCIRKLNFIDISHNKPLSSISDLVRQKPKNFKLKPKHLRDLSQFKHIPIITVRDLMPELFDTNTDNDAAIPVMKQKQLSTKNMIDGLNWNKMASLTATRPTDYQIELFLAAVCDQNGIICIPTGFGKTLIGCMLFKYYHQMYGMHRFGVFVVNKIPLVFQQSWYIQKETQLTKIKAVCGDNVNMKDVIHYAADHVNVLVITAMVFWNMLETKIFTMKRCHTLIFDEIHHGTSENHPYARIINQYVRPLPHRHRPYVIGLTASPGYKEKSIRKLCANFDCKLLKPQLYATQIDNHMLQTKWRVIQSENEIEQCFIDHIEYLALLMDIYWKHRDIHHPSTASLFQRKSVDNGALKVTQQLGDHALSILQLLYSFNVIGYIGSLFEGARLHLTQISMQNRTNQNRLIASFQKIEEQCNKVGNSSRYKTLCATITELMNKHDDAFRGIIFVDQRITVRHLITKLQSNGRFRSLRPHMIVGHNGIDGMEWFEHQAPLLKQFRNGNVKLLVSTSVLEEGLDVSQCNVVIRFDTPKTFISHIQSRGRARNRSVGDYLIIASQKQKDKKEIIFNQRTENQINSMMNRIQTQQNVYQDRRYLHTKIQSVVQEKKEDDDVLNDKQEELNTDDPYAVGETYQFNLYGLGSATDTAHLRDSLITQCIHLHHISVKHSRQMDNALFIITAHCLSNGEDLNIVHEIISNPLLPKQMIQWVRPLVACNSKKSLKVRSVYIGNLNSSLCFVKADIPSDSDMPYCFKDKTALHASGIDLPSTEVSFGDASFYVEYSLTIRQLFGPLVLSSISCDTKHHWLRFPYSSILQNRVIIDCTPHNGYKLLFCCMQSPYYGYRGTKGKFRMPFNNESNYYSYSIVLSLDCGFKDIYELISVFKSHAINVLFAEFDIVNKKASILVDLRYLFEQLYPQLMYAFDCLLSQERHRLCVHLASFCNMITQQYSDNDPWNNNKMKYFLDSLTEIDMDCNWDKYVANFIQMTDKQHWASDKHRIVLEDDTFGFIKVVTMTPSRIIYQNAQYMLLNRTVRHFGTDNFVLLRFRDENFEKMDGNHEKILQKIKSILLNGKVFAFESKRYRFVAASNSQVREHHCWMTCIDRETIHRWCGDFSAIQKPGKYLKRLAQCFSSTWPTHIIIPPRQRKSINDIYDVKEKYVFSDGVATISSHCMERVCDTVKIAFPHLTYAIQVRIAGCKGVLTSMDMDMKDDALMTVRDSMIKFPSNFNELEIVSTANIVHAHLNRQIITLLSALHVPTP
eukprot:368870_1